MTGVRYRKATLDDAAELARLRWTFSSPESQAVQDLESFAIGFEEFLHEAFESGRWVIFAAELYGRLIGNAYVQVIRKVPRPGRPNRRFGYVTNVFVEESLRGQGIGARLMREAQVWGQAQGLQMLVLWPANGRQSFYERLGFQQDTSEMEQEL